MYTYKTIIRLRDTDAAGVIYFPNLLDIAHSAFESYMEQAGYGLGKAITTSPVVWPVVHAEADYRAPLRAGDPVTVTMMLQRLGDTSFSLTYAIEKNDVLAGEVRIVHVTVDRQTRLKTPLSPELRTALKGIEER
jgi:1,4-dihydroxy-2-naphthoyl-CoA hydrolase